MRASKRALIMSAGAVLWLLAFGYVMFATAVMRPPEGLPQRADAIVVLTGGATRISEGARLLDQGRAGRMLISGVNKITSRDTLKRLSGLPPERFKCCVDLGYQALDTFGNAQETSRWVKSNGFHSLIVVTASYHMPRSMAELARAMPDTQLIAHPVVPKSFRQEVWWLHRRTVRTLASEYLKFLPAAARYGVARLMGPWDTQDTAARSVTRAGS